MTTELELPTAREQTLARYHERRRPPPPPNSAS